jgi:enterochelin esterase-like enzyme
VKDRSPAGAASFARFVVELLLPRVASVTRVNLSPARTGIDGVSMGGRLALLVGWSRPEVFGAIGALQPAIRPEEADELADLALTAHRKHPFALRLVSSEGDPFLEAVRALGGALTARGVPHQVIVTPGPHDYVWNRGPGSYEMLLWHERVLRNLPPP